MDDAELIAHLLHVIKDVGVQEYFLPLAFQSAHHVFHLMAADGIEAVKRLVEKNIFGIVHERLREPEPLAHALGVRFDLRAARVEDADFAEDGLVTAMRLSI